MYGQPILIDNEYYYPGEEGDIFFVIDEKNQIWSSDSTKYLPDKRMAKVYSQYAEDEFFAQIVLSMISMGLGYCNLAFEFFDSYTVEKENNIYYAKSNSNLNTFFIESNENNFLVLKRPYQIEGRITGGSVNIDGNSAVRRSCNLTFAISNETIENENDIMHPWMNFQASLTNRFELEIGLKNLQRTAIENNNSNIDQVFYDANTNILWFNQGQYICSSYSYSTSVNAVNISISGKDYMSLLNGELGGIIESNVDFGMFEQIQEDGSVIEVQIPVVEIIKEAVHHYGGIPFDKIKIEEELLTTPGYALKEYRYDKPLYLFRPNGTDQYIYGTLNGELPLANGTILAEIENDQFDNMIPDENGHLTSGALFWYNGVQYHLHRIDFGETAGYEQMPLVYTGDLIAKPGENITQVIDKIKNMLGDYEYFFDFKGNFIFQKKPTGHAYAMSNEEKEIESLHKYRLGTNDGTNYSTAAITNYYIIGENDIFPKYINPDSGIGSAGITGTWTCLLGDKTSKEAPRINNAALWLKTNTWCIIELFDIPFTNNFQIDATLLSGLNQDLKNIEVFHIPLSMKNSIIEDYKEATVLSLSKEILKNKYYAHQLSWEKDNAIPITNNSLVIALNTKLESKLQNFYISNVSIKPDYVFPEEKTMFTAFNNSYAISNIKNDFSIWGQRKGVSGAKIDIHGRFALQEKPTKYISLTEEGKAEQAREEYQKKYNSLLTAQGGETMSDTNPGGWREVLYQMAKDYMAFNHTEVYAKSEAFSQAKMYQPYFTDMQGFWRQLYCPIGLIKPKDSESKINLAGKPYESVEGIEYDERGWNKQINTAPWMLNFWIDFWNYIGTAYEPYAIPKIGHRPKVSNESTVTAIRYDKIPEIVFYEGIAPEIKEGEEKYTFSIGNPIGKMFSTSSRGRTVFDAAESLKLNNIECAENVSITSIPVYHLQPNTIVKIEGEEYLVTKLTIPLTYNGTMNITATKIIKTLPIENLVEYPNTGGR